MPCRAVPCRAVPMSFLLFILKKRSQRIKDDLAAIRQQCRKAYAQPWSPKGDHEEPPDEDSPGEPPENEPDDPLEPSPEL